jgi:hypothetical protein
MSILAMLLLMPALPAQADFIVDADAAPPGVADAVGVAAARWEASLAGRSGCLRPVTISFEDLDARRGEYRTREARVVVDIAVSVSDAPRVVTHELAHHAFIACGGYVDETLTAAFYSAQGLPLEREWFDYSAGWDANPAELFAEAMTAVIDGATAHGVAVTNAAKSVVQAWMEGRPLDSMPIPEATTTTSTSTSTTTTTTTTTIAAPTSTTTTTTTVAIEDTPDATVIGPPAAGTNSTPVREESRPAVSAQPAWSRLAAYIGQKPTMVGRAAVSIE